MTSPLNGVTLSAAALFQCRSRVIELHAHIKQTDQAGAAKNILTSPVRPRVLNSNPQQRTVVIDALHRVATCQALTTGSRKRCNCKPLTNISHTKNNHQFAAVFEFVSFLQLGVAH